MPREFADDKKKKDDKAKAKDEPKVETPPVKADEKPAEKDEEKKPTPTAEELAARAEEISASMFPVPGKKAVKKEEPAPVVEEKKEPEVVKEEKPVDEKKDEKPAPKKPLPPPISEAVKPEALQAPKAKVEPKEIPTSELAPDDAETLVVLARMEKDGKAPRGIGDRMKRFFKDSADYIAAWEKANPGSTFDIDADEHSEFYDKNEPKYDDSEFNRAKRTLEREEDRRINKEELKKETEAETYEREMREHKPKNEAAVTTALTEMVADAGFKDLLKDGKLTPEVEKAIDAANPHARSILMDEAQLLAAQISEIDKLERFPGKYEINPNFSVKVASGAYVQPHRMLTDFSMTLEREIAALPPEDTVRDGKRFATQEEFMGQVDKIMTSPADRAVKQKAFDALTAAYYTIGWEDIRTALIAQHSTRAKAKIDAFGGVRAKDPASEPAKPATDDKPAAPPAKIAPFKAPSISSASDNTDTAKKATHQSGKTAEDIDRAMFG